MIINVCRNGVSFVTEGSRGSIHSSGGVVVGRIVRALLILEKPWLWRRKLSTEDQPRSSSGYNRTSWQIHATIVPIRIHHSYHMLDERTRGYFSL